MQYEIVELKETKIAGFTARTNNSSPDMGTVIGGLWQRFFSAGGYDSIPDKTNGKAMGIYTDYENNENAIAVIDGSGSMTCDCGGVSPIDVALSLGIYFAEHSTGEFANHFITFSEHPRLVEINGNDIYEKVKHCLRYNEVANTDLEAVFNLILRTAVKNKLPQEELPSKIYIISDMEFDYCIEGGNSMTMFEAMRSKFLKEGYKLPDVIFWNVCSHGNNIPVNFSETGAALVSGFSPIIFNMVMGEEISPEYIMNKIILSERYEKIK